jgi:pyruvate dehydrogenase E2 component (dihydrolipoamide acetyltransferase)
MPKLSDTMTEGVVAAWHKKVGDKVSAGDLLAEIETDKATMEFESFYDGVLLYIGVEEGKSAPVNEILAIIGEPGTDISSLISEGGTQVVAENKKADSSQTPAQSATKKAPQTTSGQVVDLSKFKAEIVRMPKLSDTMTEGVVAAWHKKVGDNVSSGDILAEIETDKATMEFESFYDGVLLYIGVEQGSSAPVNSILAIIGEKGTDVSALLAAVENSSSDMPAPKQQESKVEETIQNASPLAVEASKSLSTFPPDTAAASGRIIASPLARKMARERGISLSLVKGSGENGRIVRRDIESYVPAAAAPVREQSVVVTTSEKESYRDEPVSQMRKTIARRLAESKFTAPHFYLNVEINMDNAIAARKIINEKGNAKVSFNDMVILAAAKALKKHPSVNSSWRGDFIRRNDHVHIGVAVAVEDGLLVPVVRFADKKTLQQIGAEVKEFAQKAKDKKLQPADWEGNTFTISNLGMFGIDSFTAIINPPDSCILAVGGIKEVPVVKEGQLVVGNVMKVTLSCDHRVVDGATGAAFLQTLKTYLEDPILMLA